MKNNTKFILNPNQLVCALPATVLKVWQWILGWQSQEQIKIYIKQYSKALNLSEDEIEISIQTLIDNKLIFVERVEDNWIATINADKVQEYYKVDLKKVIESTGIPLSKDVTWNKKPETPQQKGIEDMSVAELKTMLLNISARLNEHELSKQYVANNEHNDEPDDLPW